MRNKFEALSEMSDTLTKELSIANDKIRAAGGKITMEDLKYIQPLAHAIKSIDTSMAMLEAKENSSHADGAYHEGTYRDSYDEGSYEGGSGRYVSQWDENASERGRGRYAKRDSMGRYASRSYGDSYDDMRR